jgi:uncharacterized membrane protein YoaK (UPF0700 family)
MTTADSQAETDRVVFRATIPPVLSFVSGFVDTIGFLGMFGLLTSQVTGSFVAAGAAFVHAEGGLAVKLLAVPMFMVGAAAMTLLIAVLTRLRINAMPWALATVGALIALFLAIAIWAQPFENADGHDVIAAAVCAFVAMGAESALVRVLFKGALPANFMTGNVTQVAVEGTDLALSRLGVLFDGDPAQNAARAAAASKQLRVLIPMITGFMLGAIIAAHAFLAIGFWALLLATGLVFAAALWASKGGSSL